MRQVRNYREIHFFQIQLFDAMTLKYSNGQCDLTKFMDNTQQPTVQSLA